MPKYNVHLVEELSTVVTVEADNPQAAIEAAWQSPDMPGSIAHNAFGRVSVDEGGEWRPVVVTDAVSGVDVWTEHDDDLDDPDDQVRALPPEFPMGTTVELVDAAHMTGMQATHTAFGLWAWGDERAPDDRVMIGWGQLLTHAGRAGVRVVNKVPS